MVRLPSLCRTHSEPPGDNPPFPEGSRLPGQAAATAYLRKDKTQVCSPRRRFPIQCLNCISLRFLVFGFLKVSALLAAWIHLRTRDDAFSDSMGGFLLLSVSCGEAKVGHFREMLLRQSLPPLFHLRVWFCGKSLVSFIFSAVCHCCWF